MSVLSFPREIFNPAPMLRAIGTGGTPEDVRARAKEVLGAALAEGRAVVRRRFDARPNAEAALHGTAFLIDGILSVLRTLALPLFGQQNPFAVAAIGGYGRREQFPYSDVDLLLLHAQDTPGPAIEWLLYGLWDLGLTLGQSVLTVDEALARAESDMVLRTSLLDARLVCGDEVLFAQFHARFDAFVRASSTGDFVEAKLAERDARHVRVGDSRYVLEPNVKEGKGGLRDLQMLWWLAAYIYRAPCASALVELNVLTDDEYHAYHKARDFLWAVRLHLHFLAGRAEERLTFDLQRAVADAMGYHDDGTARAVERFMKQYFLAARTVGNLTRSVCAVLEDANKTKPRMALQKRLKAEDKWEGFVLLGSWLALPVGEDFKTDPERIVTLFEIAHRRGVDIHPRTLQLVSRSLWVIDAGLRRNLVANDAFMAILLSDRNPEPTLRKMSDAGVLGRFIPDFGRVVGQMQFDMYHVYTVDEHTINAIGILHGIESGRYRGEMPIASDIVTLVKSRRVLYLSLLAHDIAKGRGGDHSLLGEVVVRKLARRFGFDRHEAETCAWLVHYHLLMSRTAFKRDLADPKTLDDFVSLVQSPERLRLLLLLTVADIRAVGPFVWNGWKGALLRDLYYRAEERMGGLDAPARGSERDSLKADLAALLGDFTGAEIEAYLVQGGLSFWQAFDPLTHMRIARALRDIDRSGQPLDIHVESDDFRAFTSVLLCMPDAQGLFSRISGAIALAGANILSAKIFTLKDGMAIELFQIQEPDGSVFERPDKLARLSVFIRKAALGELDLGRELARARVPYPSRMDVFKVPPRVFIENKASANHTVIEVGGRDRLGFLHTVTHALSELGLSINTAHVTTYGERAVDVFYVKDAFGMKLQHETRIRHIHQVLLQALSGKHAAARAG